MEIRRGIPVSPGIVIAEACRIDADAIRVPRQFLPPDGDVEVEAARFDAAKRESLEQIEALREQIADDVSRAQAAMIFEAHQLILRDPALGAEIHRRIIDDRHSAEYAVTRTFRHYKSLLRGLDNHTFASRVSDFEDIEHRLLSRLTGSDPTDQYHDRDVVIVADDLTPSQIATLDREHVVGIATEAGGATSHSAILAHALQIPAVVGLGRVVEGIAGGDVVILDGNRGLIIINPDDATRARHSERVVDARREREALLAEVADLPARTKDGVDVQILANIEFVHEVDLARQLGTAGVGLFRTEFIFTVAGVRPTEDQHLAAYREAISKLDGRPLTIRTMDFGADKFARELGIAQETNPFLGCRSIRLALRRPDLFHTQLRAVLRASAHGPVRLMFPMISHLSEIAQARAALADAMADLRREGEPFDENLPVGVMVEVPAVAILAEVFAKEVDFFAIGTNDLIQYTLAVDRTNPTVAPLYVSDHPAVLELIKRTIDAGNAAGIDVDLCGEMAADPRYIGPLLAMGLRSFSVSPSSIPQLKKALSVTSVADAEAAFRIDRPCEECRAADPPPAAS
jgi:phosphotransferase system enzyme I (PtsI)